MYDYLTDEGRLFHCLIPSVIALCFIDSYFKAYTILYIAYMAYTIIYFSIRYGVMKKAKEKGEDKLTILIYGMLLIAKWVILTYIIGTIIAVISNQSFYTGYSIFTLLFTAFGIPKLRLFPKIENFE